MTYKKIKELCYVQRNNMTPQDGTIYTLYSFAAFDNNKNPEIIDGEKILSNKFEITNNTILYNKLNVKFKRVWNVENLNTENNICSTEFVPIKMREGYSQDFLYYVLTSDSLTKNMHVARKGTSNSQQRIDVNRLLEYKILCPDYEDQCRIASVLKSLDNKIKINNEINKNLEEQIQSLYTAWFVNFAPFGGENPHEWIESDIYSIANIIYGAPFSSKLFNTTGEGKPIIRIRDLKDQQFKTYTTENHPKGYLLKPGDIVVGMDGEFRPYFWGNDEAWLNQRVCVFENKRPDGKAFLYYTIKPLLYAIEQTQVGTTVIHIGKKDFDSFKVFLPDNDTLNTFDSLTSPMINIIVTNNFENKRLSALRDTLLPKLMSGELDVSSLEI